MQCAQLFVAERGTRGVVRRVDDQNFRAFVGEAFYFVEINGIEILAAQVIPADFDSKRLGHRLVSRKTRKGNDDIRAGFRGAGEDVE